MSDVEPSARPTLGTVLGLSLGLGALVFFALVAAGMARGAVGWLPLGALVGATIVGVGPLHAVVARARHPRAAIGSYLGLGIVGPFVLLVGLGGLSDPLITSRFFCGTGQMGLIILGVPTVAGLAGLGGFVATVLALRGGRRFDAAVAWCAVACVFVATSLVTGGALRAARAPEPDRWIESVPLIGVLDADHADGRVEPSPLRPDGSDPVVAVRDHVQGLTFVRLCDGRHGVACTAPAACTAELQVVRGDASREVARGVDCDRVLGIRRDNKHGIWIVDDRFAFSDVDLAQRDVRIDDVSDSLGPPRGSLAVAAAGLLLACFLELRRRAARRSLARVVAGVSGFAEPNGWVALDDGLGSVRVDAVGAVPAGPVVVVSGEANARARGVYRGEGPLGRVTVLAGDKVDLLERGRAHLSALGAQVLVTVALTSAPLAAAALRGLVF